MLLERKKKPPSLITANDDRLKIQCNRFLSEGLALAPPTLDPGRPSALLDMVLGTADAPFDVTGAEFAGVGAARARPAPGPISTGVEGCFCVTACAADVATPVVDVVEAFLLWPCPLLLPFPLLLSRFILWLCRYSSCSG